MKGKSGLRLGNSRDLAQPFLLCQRSCSVFTLAENCLLAWGKEQGQMVVLWSPLGFSSLRGAFGCWWYCVPAFFSGMMKEERPLMHITSVLWYAVVSNFHACTFSSTWTAELWILCDLMLEFNQKVAPGYIMANGPCFLLLWVNLFFKNKQNILDSFFLRNQRCKIISSLIWHLAAFPSKTLQDL